MTVQEIASGADVLGWLKATPELRERLQDRAVDCQPIGSGRLYQSFAILDRKGEGIAVVKQALTTLRSDGEEWPLERRHALFERRALELQDSICPGMVPEVYHSDTAAGILVLQYLEDAKPLDTRWRDGANAMPTPNNVADFCARIAFRTSDYFMSIDQKMTLVEFFAPNLELTAFTHRRLFLTPFLNCPFSFEDDPMVAEQVALLRHDVMTRHECLSHGCLTARHILTDAESTYIISPTFAAIGPLGLDPGMLFGQMLSLAWLNGADGIEMCVAWIHAFWRRFEHEFHALWRSENHGEGTPSDFYDEFAGTQALDAYRSHILGSALRRSIGVAGCELFAIACQRHCDEKVASVHGLARELILNHCEVQHIEEVGSLVMAHAGERLSG